MTDTTRVPDEELKWWQLKQGDRVSHFDYGVGTVDGAGPVWVCITWDNPDEHVNCHTVEIVRYLCLEGVAGGEVV
ncbi:hypothetical protein [Kribbella sp. NPDC055071]